MDNPKINNTERLYTLKQENKYFLISYIFAFILLFKYYFPLVTKSTNDFISLLTRKWTLEQSNHDNRGNIKLWSYNLIQYLCFMPWIEQSGENTGSMIDGRLCGSRCCWLMHTRCPLGPLACTLYCQKYRSFLLLEPEMLPVSSLTIESGGKKSSHNKLFVFYISIYSQ